MFPPPSEPPNCCTTSTMKMESQQPPTDAHSDYVSPSPVTIRLPSHLFNPTVQSEIPHSPVTEMAMNEGRDTKDRSFGDEFDVDSRSEDQRMMDIDERFEDEDSLLEMVERRIEEDSFATLGLGQMENKEELEACFPNGNIFVPDERQFEKVTREGNVDVEWKLFRIGHLKFRECMSSDHVAPASTEDTVRSMIAMKESIGSGSSSHARIMCDAETQTNVDRSPSESVPIQSCSDLASGSSTVPCVPIHADTPVPDICAAVPREVEEHREDERSSSRIPPSPQSNTSQTESERWIESWYMNRRKTPSPDEEVEASTLNTYSETEKELHKELYLREEQIKRLMILVNSLQRNIQEGQQSAVEIERKLEEEKKKRVCVSTSTVNVGCGSTRTTPGVNVSSTLELVKGVVCEAEPVTKSIAVHATNTQAQIQLPLAAVNGASSDGMAVKIEEPGSDCSEYQSSVFVLGSPMDVDGCCSTATIADDESIGTIDNVKVEQPDVESQPAVDNGTGSTTVPNEPIHGLSSDHDGEHVSQEPPDREPTLNVGTTTVSNSNEPLSLNNVSGYVDKDGAFAVAEDAVEVKKYDSQETTVDAGTGRTTVPDALSMLAVSWSIDGEEEEVSHSPKVTGLVKQEDPADHPIVDSGTTAVTVSNPGEPVKDNTGSAVKKGAIASAEDIGQQLDSDSHEVPPNLVSETKPEPPTPSSDVPKRKRERKPKLEVFVDDFDIMLPFPEDTDMKGDFDFDPDRSNKRKRYSVEKQSFIYSINTNKPYKSHWDGRVTVRFIECDKEIVKKSGRPERRRVPFVCDLFGHVDGWDGQDIVEYCHLDEEIRANIPDFPKGITLKRWKMGELKCDMAGSLLVYTEGMCSNTMKGGWLLGEIGHENIVIYRFQKNTVQWKDRVTVAIKSDEGECAHYCYLLKSSKQGDLIEKS